jgi:hypothetical protein
MGKNTQLRPNVPHVAASNHELLNEFREWSPLNCLLLGDVSDNSRFGIDLDLVSRLDIGHDTGTLNKFITGSKPGLYKLRGKAFGNYAKLANY